MGKKLLYYYSIFCAVNILVLALLLFIPRISYDPLNMLVLLPMAVLLINILYVSNNMSNRIVFFMYQVGFFTFLLGEVFFGILNNNRINLYNLSRAAYSHTLISMTISLLCIFLSYYICQKKVNTDNYHLYMNSYDDIYIRKIRSISQIIYCTSFFAQIAVLIEKAIFVGNKGYTDYYLSYTSRLPLFITGLPAFYYISFYSFLATLPSKKKAYPCIFLYILAAILSLGFGQRNGFVLDLIMLIIYLVYRNKLEIKNKRDFWITKKHVIIGICILPIILILLQNIGVTRLGGDASTNTFGKRIEEFFIAQGGSIHTINYGYEYKSQILKQDIVYILGPIKDYLTQNVISRSILGFESWQHDPFVKAEKASLFGATLAYILFPEGYLIGKGMDSSYIAELYQDFGYIGIIVGSLVIGVLLNFCDTIRVKHWWSYALMLIVARGVIYLPRTSALGWVTKTLNVPNVLGLLMIALIAHISKTNLKEVKTLGNLK